MISTGRSRHSDGIPVLTGSPTSNKVDIPVTLRFYNAILLYDKVKGYGTKGKVYTQKLKYEKIAVPRKF